MTVLAVARRRRSHEIAGPGGHLEIGGEQHGVDGRDDQEYGPHADGSRRDPMGWRDVDRPETEDGQVQGDDEHGPEVAATRPQAAVAFRAAELPGQQVAINRGAADWASGQRGRLRC